MTEDQATTIEDAQRDKPAGDDEIMELRRLNRALAGAGTPQMQLLMLTWMSAQRGYRLVRDE